MRQGQAGDGRLLLGDLRDATHRGGMEDGRAAVRVAQRVGGGPAVEPVGVDGVRVVQRGPYHQVLGHAQHHAAVHAVRERARQRRERDQLEQVSAGWACDHQAGGVPRGVGQRRRHVPHLGYSQFEVGVGVRANGQWGLCGQLQLPGRADHFCGVVAARLVRSRRVERPATDDLGSVP